MDSLKTVSKAHYDNKLGGRKSKILMRAFFYARWYKLSLIIEAIARLLFPARGGEDLRPQL